MTFDPQTIGTHAGTGMLGSFLAYFGIKQRIDRIEKGQDEIRQWIESSGNKVVYKDVHETCSQSWHAMFAQTNQSLSEMNKKLDALLMQLAKSNQP
jgi:hypothetical protein